MKQNNINIPTSYDACRNQSSFYRKPVLYKVLTLSVLLALSVLPGCGGSEAADSNVSSVEVSSVGNTNFTPNAKVLSPVASGNNTIGNDNITIDISNSADGYIVLNYSGMADKVKFQLTGNDQITYTYNILPGEEIVVPLSADSGDYNVTVFESIQNDQYAIDFTDNVNLSVSNTFGPYLYPNQYVSFNEKSQAIAKASELIKDCTCELEAVSKIYDFVINNVTYDKEEAETVASDYLPDVDEVLSTGKGICFDYAALMAAMLRGHGIPTKLEIGYAKDAYHAWISVYTVDQGWIGGVIQFDGSTWTLMDPTLASNSKDISKIKEFIGDGSSYTTKYTY